LAKAAELAMHSLDDGTIYRLAQMRDRLEAGILQLPGTGVNGASPSDCHPERAQRVEGSAVAFSNGMPGATGLASETWESKPIPRAANTSNIWFDQLEGEALVIALDLKGLSVSGGSACHSGATEPSHVLMAMGLDKARARASLRFSLLKTVTEADIDYALEVVPAAVERLRELAPEMAGTSPAYAS
jgi:cysteine desulfurase